MGDYNIIIDLLKSIAISKNPYTKAALTNSLQKEVVNHQEYLKKMMFEVDLSDTREFLKLMYESGFLLVYSTKFEIVTRKNLFEYKPEEKSDVDVDQILAEIQGRLL